MCFLTRTIHQSVSMAIGILPEDQEHLLFKNTYYEIISTMSLAFHIFNNPYSTICLRYTSIYIIMKWTFNCMDKKSDYHYGIWICWFCQDNPRRNCNAVAPARVRIMRPNSFSSSLDSTLSICKYFPGKNKIISEQQVWKVDLFLKKQLRSCTS